MMSPGSISIEAVVVEHHGANGRVRALDGISFTVERGSSVAVIGPSGGGKSTLLGIIGGLARPTTGTVRIGGLDLSGSTERDRSDFRRRRLGFVYQSDNLLPFLTVSRTSVCSSPSTASPPTPIGPSSSSTGWVYGPRPTSSPIISRAASDSEWRWLGRSSTGRS